MKCLRCEDGELEKQEESTEEMQFLTCKECGRRYARGPGGELHDRWLSALSLILYSQIFVRDPRTTGADNARRLAERWPDGIDSMIEEIERDLDHPTQRVSEIHAFEYADEEALRAHLRDVAETLKAMRT